MKKRYLILAGILAASMLAAGCGKKNSVAPEQKVEATATPTVTEAAKTDVVEMQTSTDETANIKNVMGTKSETTTSIVFTNKMNSTISAIYVRPTRDDGDDSDETWGSDLVNSKFTLASNDKAVYYMEKSQKDDNGDTATSFDVKITFTDEEQNECFFRQLPLLTISQLSLCMDGEGEDGIPYATYLASGSTKEVSTLKDVKARLGIEDDSESDSDSTDSSDSTTSVLLDTSKELTGIHHAEIEVKDYGTIDVELDADTAPITVTNFVKLAQEGFYDGLTFHRIMDGFMIQGGCPDGTGMGGPGYSIKGEFKQNGFANDLKHEPGVLSMARAMHPDSAGSQFFIMHKTSPHLDGAYAAFGKVTEGMDVVNKIAETATDYSDRPLEEQKMKKVTVETFGEAYPEPERV